MRVQCVRLTRFESDRTISFVPPDGEFELMSYRLHTAVKPLLWVETYIEAHGRRCVGTEQANVAELRCCRCWARNSLSRTHILASSRR